MESHKSNRMLAILAHPDDESIDLGGTLAKYANQGIQVVLLTATRGEISIPGVEPNAARSIHEQELRKAAGYLGIEVYFLDYQTGELSQVDFKRLMEHISCWIDTIRPQVILTFGPDGISGNPDHVIVSQVVTRVVEKYFPNICLLYIAPSEDILSERGISSPRRDANAPLISVDISEYKVAKMRAMQCHASQRPPLIGKTEDEVDKLPCHEYFRVAHPEKSSNDLVDCLGLEKEFADPLV